MYKVITFVILTMMLVVGGTARAATHQRALGQQEPALAQPSTTRTFTTTHSHGNHTHIEYRCSWDQVSWRMELFKVTPVYEHIYYHYYTQVDNQPAKLAYEYFGYEPKVNPGSAVSTEETC